MAEHGMGCSIPDAGPDWPSAGPTFNKKITSCLVSDVGGSGTAIAVNQHMHTPAGVFFFVFVAGRRLERHRAGFA